MSALHIAAIAIASVANVAALVVIIKEIEGSFEKVYTALTGYTGHRR